MEKKNKRTQLVWGIALTLSGIGVLIRVPYVMPKIEQIEQFAAMSLFIRFCFYFIAIILIGGGGKKILKNFR